MYQNKSMAAALILTFFFGPLGLFYVSILGGIIMTSATCVSLLLAVLSFGILSFLVPILWAISMIWAALGTDAANKAARRL